ncbi:MAG: hypothetical protein CMN56_06400 [Sneathiella sp.]|uniref:hypothetical protein n=1 Tax=Sneathiella sp. TaxID=1964365 RepID=UPI000C6650EA|nr:hypothetical protein [Sneathiella sp.]MAZ02751.1 hypothetical protein [Sneathiella sp.]
MLFPRKIASSVTVFLLSAIIGHSALAAEADKFDVVGLSLGMTTEEAMQALRDFGVMEESISETRLSFFYTDGLKNDYRTEEFLYRVSAGKKPIINGMKRHEDGIVLYFSPPPEGGRLVGIERNLINRIDPVTGAQFKEAVFDKYGAPTDENGRAFNWKFGGGDKNCLSTSLDKTGVVLPEGGKSNKSILDMVYKKTSGQYRLDLFRVSRIKSLEECANMLEFTIPGDTQPADRVRATMIDIQSWVRAELAAGEEVARLQKEAIEKREGKGKKPTL